MKKTVINKKGKFYKSLDEDTKKELNNVTQKIVKKQIKEIEKRRKVRETTERFIDPMFPSLVEMSTIGFPTKKDVKEIIKTIPINSHISNKEVINTLRRISKEKSFSKDEETFTQADKVEDCKTVVGLFAITLIGVWVWWILSGQLIN